jgi:TonB family protein
VFETQIVSFTRFKSPALYLSVAMHAGVVLLALIASVRAERPVASHRIIHWVQYEPVHLVFDAPVLASREVSRHRAGDIVEPANQPAPPTIQALATDLAAIPPHTPALPDDAETEEQLRSTGPVFKQPLSLVSDDDERAIPIPLAPDTNVVRVGGRLQRAEILTQTTPTYPPLARAARVEGVVALTMVITESGTVDQIHVISGHPMLIQAAIDCVRQWRYRPAMLNEKPVKSPLKVDVRFRLEYK